MRKLLVFTVFILFLAVHGSAQQDFLIYSQAYKSAGHSICRNSDTSALIMTGPGVLCVDRSGEQLWSRRYLTNGVIGGRVSMAANGDIFVLYRQQTIGAGNGDLIFFRMDSVGNIRWIRTYGTSWMESPMDFVELENGNIMILATVQGFSGIENTVLIQAINENGDQLWQRSYLSDAGPATASAICGRSSTGIYFLAAGSGTAWLVHADTNGSIQWSLGFDKAIPQALTMSDDGNNLYLGGRYFDSTQSTNSGAFFCKLSADGQIRWQRHLEPSAGAENSELLFIKCTGDRLYAGGKYLASSADEEAYQALMLTADTAGNNIGQHTLGWTGIEAFRDMEVMGEGRCLWTGSTTAFGSDTTILLVMSDSLGNTSCSTVVPTPQWISSGVNSYDPGIISDTGNLDRVTYCFPPNDEVLALKRVCSASFVAQSNEEFNFQIYPNPATASISIKLPAHLEGNLRFSIYSSAGRCVHLSEISPAAAGSTILIPLDGLCHGLYLFDFLGNQGRTTAKILVE